MTYWLAEQYLLFPSAQNSTLQDVLQTFSRTLLVGEGVGMMLDSFIATNEGVGEKEGGESGGNDDDGEDEGDDGESKREGDEESAGEGDGEGVGEGDGEGVGEGDEEGVGEGDGEGDCELTIQDIKILIHMVSTGSNIYIQYRCIYLVCSIQ